MRVKESFTEFFGETAFDTLLQKKEIQRYVKAAQKNADIAVCKDFQGLYEAFSRMSEYFQWKA